MYLISWSSTGSVFYREGDWIIGGEGTFGKIYKEVTDWHWFWFLSSYVDLFTKIDEFVFLFFCLRYVWRRRHKRL